MNEIPNLEALLNEDLSDVDISRPLLEPTTAVLRIADCKIEVSDRSGKNLLVVRTETQQPMAGKSHKGEPKQVNPGFTLIERVCLTPSDKYPVERIRQEMKRFMEAVGEPGGAFGDPKRFIGREIAARITIEDDPESGYDAQNRLKFVPLAKVATETPSL